MRKLTPVLLVLLLSCYSSKKAAQQVNKAAVSYPNLIAEKAKVMFPCVPAKGDSVVIYVSDSTAYQQTLGLLQLQIQADAMLLDSLFGALQAGDDSTGKGYISVIGVLKKRNTDLSYRLAHVEPITVTKTVTLPAVEDTRKIFLCEQERGQVVTLLTSKTAESDKWEGKAKTRFWISFALIAALLISLYFNVRKLFKL